MYTSGRIRPRPARMFVLQVLGQARAQRAALVYTAHSIPEAMAAQAPYTQQFAATAAAATQLLGRQDYRLAYQSQVHGTPRPWLQPDINEAIRQIRAEGYRDVIISPIGFLCDHVEVLYDLDVEAQRTAAACGVTYTTFSGMRPMPGTSSTATSAPLCATCSAAAREST